MSVPSFFPWVSRITTDDVNLLNGTIKFEGAGGITFSQAGQVITVTGSGGGGGNVVGDTPQPADGLVAFYNGTEGLELSPGHIDGPRINPATGDFQVDAASVLGGNVQLGVVSTRVLRIISGLNVASPINPVVVTDWIQIDNGSGGTRFLPLMT